ncbi:MAG TPA: hypothetical protein VL857_05985 [Candidatus Eisenbacteria bacterium]|jgi:hypothetical protein|nr:hypothetical protein [Candidatus Eisenbacteria bacterium]
MVFLERSIGSETETFHSSMVYHDLVFVGSLYQAHAIEAFLRGFKLSYAGHEDHHVKYMDVKIQANANGDSGYIIITANVTLQEDVGLIFGGDTRASCTIDYTLAIF